MVKNKIGVLLLLGILMINFTSAMEIDNWINYENNDLKVRIVNNWNFGADLGTAELKSHKSVNEILKVAPGKDRVTMYYDFNFNEVYENGLGEVKFINMTSGEYINKDYHFVFWGTTLNQKNNYTQECNEVYNKINGSFSEVCNNVLVGTYQEQTEGWIKFDSTDIPKGNIRIGLSTDVSVGEEIDGIWTIAGKEIVRHAVWTADLNVDIVSYWKLDEENGTTAIDSLGLNNGTNTLAVVNQTGKIDRSYNFTHTTANYVDLGTSSTLNPSNMSISLWFNQKESSGNDVLIARWGSGDAYVIEVDFANHDIRALVETAGGTNDIQNTSAVTSFGIWYHAVLTWDSASGGILYLNGQNIATGNTFPGAVNSIGEETVIGALDNTGTLSWGGSIDEVGFWNRTLNQSEILQLYNNGNAITWTDVFVPIVNLNFPLNGDNISQSLIEFNCSAEIASTETLENISLYTNESGVWEAKNITTGLSGNLVVQTWNRTLADGNYIYSCEACSLSGECSFAGNNNTFSVDTIVPIITVESPTGTLDYNFIENNETLNVTFTDISLDSCWYNYNGTNITIEGCLTGVKNSTEFILETDNTNMTIYANDTVGNLNSTFISWNYIILELNQTYDQNTTESTTNDFAISIKVLDGSSLTGAIFSYNQTNYTTNIIFNSGLYLITSSIVSPTVDADTNFSFNFFLIVDNVTYTTSSNNQTIVNSLFDICGGSSNDTLLNMSLIDEGTVLNISGDIEISASIISKTSGVSIGTVNNTFENVGYGAICFSPVSSYGLYYLDAEIRYSSDGYAAEFYHIQKGDMEEYPINLSLYDLNQNDSTEFTVTYKNNAFIFIEGAVIQLQRKYIGEDTYEVVEAPITGDGGKAILHIDLNTNKYRASVVKDGELLDFFDNIVFSCDNELAGDCTHSLDGTVNPNNDIPIETITDFSYSVIIDEDNQTITVLFAVPSGTPSTINVLLEQIDMFGNLTSCNTTIVTSAGSITCDYTDTIEKSILELSISKNDVQLAVKSYVNDPDLDMDGMNFFIVFLFMISLVGMAIASPEWMIIISVMVLIISGTLLLLKGMSLVMGLGAIAWVIIAAAIIILKMAKQEDR